MKDRIAKVIADQGITRAKFAEELHVSPGLISQICSGTTNPSERTLTDICDKFNVNPVWLRTGEGEPYRELTPEERVAQALGGLIKGDIYARNRLIVTLAEIIRLKDEGACQAIEELIIEYAAELEKKRRIAEAKANR